MSLSAGRSVLSSVPNTTEEHLPGDSVVATLILEAELGAAESREPAVEDADPAGFRLAAPPPAPGQSAASFSSHFVWTATPQALQVLPCLLKPQMVD